jgi:REP element-mobilizing transposase RayT
MTPVPRIYKNDTHGVCFVTFTIIEWIDVFTKPAYLDLLAESFRFCIEKKGLILYEYVFMTNHIHFIAGATDQSNGIDSILRDFKRYTTNELRKLFENDRRQYLGNLFYHSFQKKAGTIFQVWQRENYPEYIETERFRNQKSQYIWMNPVKRKYVSKPEDWLYSSARQKILQLPKDHPEVFIPCEEWP